MRASIGLYSLCMVKWIPVALASILAWPNPRSLGSTGPACQQLAASYPALLALPNSTIYDAEKIEYWDMAAVLSPSCIFTPKTPQDVAGGLAILGKTQTHFAVRSGGHTPIPGASSIDDGVLLAADSLINIELGTVGNAQVVRVGTGLRWIEVYQWLANRKLTAIGGRYATVGAGGLSLGGGINYYRSVHGWAADNILNYEVVTAQGQILEVNAKSHADLFWALKGGSGNFGFVTRFDLAIFPLIEIFGGNFLTNASGVPALVKATAAFADAVNGGSLDPLAAANPTVQLELDTRQLSSFTNLFYNASLASPPEALKQFTDVPTSAPSTVTGPRSFIGFMNETAVFANNMRRLFRATSVKCSPEAVELVEKVFINESSKLRNVTAGSVTVTYQYMSQSFLEASHNVGDAIDLDPLDGPFIAILLASAWDLATDDSYLLNFLTSLVNKIDTASKGASLYYPFVYLNDAGIGQNPFPYYGSGKSLSSLQSIAKKYDPNSVFQSLASGAFKLTS